MQLFQYNTGCDRRTQTESIRHVYKISEANVRQ